jgi:hypothetical protein
MKWVMALALAAVASGQQIDLSALDKLSSRAKSVVNVTLDEDKLKFASAFLSNEDTNQEAAKTLVGGLKSINVRVFEFDKPGSFASSDMDAIRSQLRTPGWSKLVEARDGDEIAEVYMYSKGKDLGGITVIAGEKLELAVVNIVGPVDLKTLGSLAGKFGIPKDVMGGGPSAPKQVAPRKPTPPAPQKD